MTIELSIRHLSDATLVAELRVHTARTTAVLASRVPITIDTLTLRALSIMLDEYGTALTAMVLPPLLHAPWEKARSYAEHTGAGLDVRVVLDDPSGALHGLFWERLRDPRTNASLAQQEGGSLARLVEIDDLHAPEPPARSALRALVAIAGPSDAADYRLAPVDVAGEAERALQAMGSIHAILLAGGHLRSSGFATLANVRDGLRTGPAILYLVCHGATTAEGTILYLVGDDGHAAPIDGATLDKEFRALDAAHRPLVAVLVACESANQDEAPLVAVGPLLARLGIPAVIAMQARISLNAVARFTPRLLRELERDGRIDRALAAARKELGDEWWVPVLWLRVRDGRLWAAPAPMTASRYASDQPPFVVPMARPPGFVGRTAELARLEQLLTGSRAASVAVAPALAGIGGIGKSVLALEFAYRFAARFPGGVFWLNMAQADGVAQQIAACASACGLAPTGFTFDEQVAYVQRWWAGAKPCLLIFDNVEEPALLERWHPHGSAVGLLITTRSTAWPAHSGAVALLLPPLPNAESLELLLGPRATALACAFTDLLAAPDERVTAEQLVSALGGLPLALALAGHYLEERPRLPLADYLAELRNEAAHHRSLNAELTVGLPGGHAASVVATFALSYNRLRDENRTDVMARAIWFAASQCAPAPIPADLLLCATGLDPTEPGQRDAGDQMLRRLGAIGLLGGNATDGYQIHPLLAAYARSITAQPAHDQKRLQEALGDRLLFLGEHRQGFTGRMYLPHAAKYAQVMLAEATPSVSAGAFIINLANLLQTVGDTAAARPLYERALSIREQTLGPTHPATANSLDNLANLLQTVGDYAAACPLYERVLSILEQTLGPAHPDTAASLNNLANLLQTVGNYAAARPLYERALSILEQTLGPAHPDTAMGLTYLALLLKDVGDTAAARPLHERALAIFEQTLGPAHPDTDRSLTTLAILLKDVGDTAAARPLYERALAIREQILDPTHPDTARSLNNLASLLQTVGDYAAARPRYERALAIYEQTLGPAHPDTARSLNSLASLLRNVGELAKAAALYRRLANLLRANPATSYNNSVPKNRLVDPALMTNDVIGAAFSITVLVLRTQVGFGALNGALFGLTLGGMGGPLYGWIFAGVGLGLGVASYWQIWAYHLSWGWLWANLLALSLGWVAPPAGRVAALVVGLLFGTWLSHAWPRWMGARRRAGKRGK